MNTKSLRFRLTLWYSFSFILSICVIFASFYYVTRQVLYNQTDTTLTTHGNAIVDVVTRQGNDMHENMAKQAFIKEFSQMPGMLFVVMNREGEIVVSSQAVNPEVAALKNLFNKTKLNDNAIFQNQTIGQQLMRFTSIPVKRNKDLIGVVLVGHPIEVIEKSLNNLVTLMGTVFILLFLPTILGGYLHARSAVQPISEMSEKIKRITSKNLDERIENPKTGDEIAELSLSFNSLLDRLSEAFRRERQFIGDLAHELKTPLATQRSNIEVILSKDRSKEEYKEALSESLEDNNRITTTVKNILDLAWSEAENAKTHTEIIDLSKLLDELEDIAVKMAHPKKIAIKGKIEQNIKIKGKHDKIFRALLNIIDNSVKYTPSKGTVSLSLHKTSQEAIVQIKDSGVGIAKSDLPHIFERFYRGSKVDKTFGSGLGLAIAQAIINAHHGKISVESKTGNGTSVTIHFPLH